MKPSPLLSCESAFRSVGRRFQLAVAAALAVAPFGLRVPTIAAAPADFSAGIERFRALGLPDVKDAKYIKIDWRSSPSMMMFGGIGPGNELKLEGNAWLLEQKDPQHAIVLLDQAKRVELVDPKLAEERQKKMLEQMQKQGPGADFTFYQGFDEEATGTWKEADLEKDIQKVVAFLQKKTPGEEEGPMRMFSFQQIGGAGLFLFAAHIHRKGHVAEANEIIDLLFKKAGDNRLVLGQAMNKLADVQYQTAYGDFEKSGDWKHYLEAMEALIAKFPGVWRERPVVERVAASVRKQLSFQAPPPVAGEGLADEDQKLADELAKADPPINSMTFLSLNSLWVVNRSEMLPGMGGGSTALDHILKRRLKSIPLLLALLKDDYLVRTKGSRNSSTSYFSDNDEPMSEEEIERQYQDFSRPVSRGEIARKLLEPLVVADQERYRSDQRPGPDEIARRARAWYDKHKNQSEGELLRLFLTEGQPRERQNALNALLASEEETDRQAVEKYLLSPDKVAENLNQVVQYAQMNGAKARPLVEKYLQAAKALPSLLPNEQMKHLDESFRKRMEEQAKAQLKVLEELVSDKTAVAVLQEALAANKKWTPQEWTKVNGVFWNKIAGEPPDKVVGLLLRAALDTKDDFLAQALVQSTGQVQYMSLQRQMRRRMTAPPKPAKLDLNANSKLWQQLLAQKRSASAADDEDGMEMAMGFGQQMSFRQMVGMTIEGLYGGQQAQMRGMEMMQQLGNRVYDIYLQRAEARLAGKPEAELPGFPDKDKVTEARKGELHQQLAAATPASQTGLAVSLSLDETLVLADLVKADPKLNTKLAPGSHVIQKVHVGLKNDELRKACEALVSKPLDRKAVELLVEQGKKLATNKVSAMIVISRSVPLGGVQIAVRNTPAMMADAWGGFGERMGPSKAMLMAQLMAMTEEEPIYGNAQWMIPLPASQVAKAKPEQKETKGKKDDDLLQSALDSPDMSGMFEQQQEEFWKALDKLLAPTFNACTPYNCSLIVMHPQTAKE